VSHTKELYRIKELVSNKGYMIEFNGDYYEVLVESSIYLEKIEYPPKCVKVCDEELSEYPTLKRAIDLASKSGAEL